jgi:hypothetical protein
VNMGPSAVRGDGYEASRGSLGFQAIYVDETGEVGDATRAEVVDDEQSRPRVRLLSPLGTLVATYFMPPDVHGGKERLYSALSRRLGFAREMVMTD